MTVSIAGPEWSVARLDQRSGMYPLQVEAHILNSVERLVPGLSSVTRYARYYALYAALAAHAFVRILTDPRPPTLENESACCLRTGKPS
jgi:hypothetical protein